MGGTSEHITLRIPKDVIQALRREALELERSVSWVIVRKLSSAGRSSAVEDRLGTHQKKAGETRAAVGSNPTPGHHLRCGCSICRPPK